MRKWKTDIHALYTKRNSFTHSHYTVFQQRHTDAISCNAGNFAMAEKKKKSGRVKKKKKKKSGGRNTNTQAHFLEVFSGERAGGTAGGGGGGERINFPESCKSAQLTIECEFYGSFVDQQLAKIEIFFPPPLSSLLLPPVFQPSYNLSNDDRRVEREREREKGVSVKRRIKDEKRERERKRVKCA